MGVRITDKLVRELVAPASGNRIVYDDPRQGPRSDEGVRGFGIRITAAGARSFVLNYRNSEGRERRHTIGGYPELSVEAARKAARGLRSKIRLDKHDPRAERAAILAAPTVGDLCDRYISDHLPRKRDLSAADDKAMIAKIIRPRLGSEKVASIRHLDIDRLHQGLRTTPYRANRVLSLLSKMFNLAEKWGWYSGNPVKGVERYPEDKRERYLSAEEIGRLTEALARYEDQSIANIVRLLLLTGARRGEVLQAKWSQLDLDAGVWVKPSAMTKQKAVHRVPLSDGAVALLRSILDAAPRHDDGRLKSEFVFPGPRSGKPMTEIKTEWAQIAIAAGLYDTVDGKNAKGEPVEIKKVNCRLHDLRHTYASILASAGLSLPIIGRLLGHTQTSTTARYSHLMDDPLRQATNQVSAIVSGKKPAEVVPIREGAA